MSKFKRADSVWPGKISEEERLTLQTLGDSLLPGFKQLLNQEHIKNSDEFNHAHQHIYLPFCHWLVQQQQQNPLVVGINGSQGSGKSTLTRILKYLLESGFNKKVALLSIDDLYKTQQQRQQLARDIHPLLITRGVPGTHDIELGINIFEQLLAEDIDTVDIPVFDKASDDRAPRSHWQQFSGQCDIILFEGWCVGTSAEEATTLLTPVNTLEESEDNDARWRQYVNQQLKDNYCKLFNFIDIQLLLKIPDFNKVFEWRKLQEKKLSKQFQLTSSCDVPQAIMNEKQIERFIMHYERLTRHTLNEMPDRCDVVFELGGNHMIENIRTKI